MPLRYPVALGTVLRWFRKVELKCPVCGTLHRVSARWLDGSKPFRCDCDRYTFYPEAERLRRQAEQESR